MNLEKLILTLKAIAATITGDDAKKKTIEDQIASLEIESKKQLTKKDNGDGSPVVIDEATRQLIDALKGQVEGLSNALTAETKTRKEQADAMAAKAKKDQEQKIADYIKKAVETDKKISPADMKEKWQALLEANFDATSKIIDAMPIHPAAKTLAKPSDGQSTEQKEQAADNYFSNKKPFVEAAIAELKSSTN
jgi:hypothetical protein